MNAAAVSRVATCQLRITCTVNRLRLDDGLLFSVTTMPNNTLNHPALLCRCNSDAHRQSIPAPLDYTTTAPNGGRCAHLNRTIPITTAPDAV